MKRLLRFAATFLAAVGFSLPAAATNFSTDFTDMWWAGTSEDGWGLNLIQQNNIIFATLFVYGPGDTTAKWLVASDLRASSQSSFSGTLFRTTGSPFPGAWNPAQRTVAAVGSMSITFSGPNNGTLVYTADGATVTKAITRYTYATHNLSGNYLGGMSATAFNCRSATDNGAALIFGDLTITGTTSPSMRVDFNNNNGGRSTCTFNGNYTQTGRVGTITGTFACSTGGTAQNSGTFTINQMDVSVNGLNGSFTGSDQFCSYNGFFGGLKDVL